MRFDWLKKPVVVKTARVAGYVVFGVASFLIAAVLTFPTERLRSYLENRLSIGGAVVRIDDITLKGLSSASLEGIRIELPVEQGDSKPQGEETIRRVVSLDRIDVSVSLIRLLLGTIKASLKVTRGEGCIGPIRITKASDKVTIDVTEIKSFPWMPEFPIMGHRFSGMLDGKAFVSWDLKNGAAASTGRFELVFSGLKALKPTIKSESQGSVTLTDVDLGRMTIMAVLDKSSNIAALKTEKKTAGAETSVLHLEKVEVEGSDLKAVMEGHSMIRPVQGKGLSDSLLNVEFAFALNEAFFDRSVTIGGEQQNPNRFLRTLLNMTPQWKAAQSGGYYGVVCTGTLRSPSCTPRKSSVRGGEFKAPPKEEEKVAKPAQPAPTPSQPAVVPSPPPTTPPPSLAPTPSGSNETPQVEPLQQPQEQVAPAIIGVPRRVTPTIIGRPKVRIRELEQVEEETPAESGTVAPQPSNEE